MNVRIAGISRESVSDGPGFRSVIFFQGCPHHCPGCHNPQTRDFNGGNLRTIDWVIEELQINPLISGVTFSGGEPFSQAEAAALIAERLKRRKLNLWVYSGFTWEELLADMEKPGYRTLLSLTDVVVDGPFLIKQRDINLPYCGSKNQRLIYAPKSFNNGQIELWNPDTVLTK